MVGRKPYGVDSRNIVARLRYVFFKTIREISDLVNVSKSTVHRWIHRHIVGRKKQHERRYKKLWNERVRSLLEATLQRNPFETVQHIKQQLQEHGVKCRSSSTVSKWIRSNLQYSRKRVTGRYFVRNERIENITQEFKTKVSQAALRPDQAISIDETSIYFSENSKYGYTPKGVPLRHRVQSTAVRMRRLTLLLAVSSEKVVHYKLFAGSCNSSVFSKFIDEIPSDAPRAILMDNVAFHKTKAVKEAMKKANFSEWFVPPYSPEYNPIEYVFAALKKKLRAHVDVHGVLTDGAIDSLIGLTLSQKVLDSCFRHCWKLLEGTSVDARVFSTSI